ncbi:UbiA family prenyltransferase [bacterium]|nr:UbiA family prenyltransferase [bacterium]
MNALRPLLEKTAAFLDLVKFAHTIFAMPFALMAVLVVSDGLPPLAPFLWILLAMVSARTAAMTFNRIADRTIDARNPRTRNRPLQTGRVKLWEAWTLWAVASGLFILAAGRLNPLAFTLSWPVLAILCGYSFIKRFAPVAHLVLGLALGCAPLGAWIALAGRIEAPPLVLGLAVLFWVAGFDVIYACQDDELDKNLGLHSLVTALGRRRALLASRLFHVLAAALLLVFGATAHLGGWYYAGVVIAAVALAWEQSLVSPGDLSRVNTAFFTANGLVGLSLFGFTAADILL